MGEATARCSRIQMPDPILAIPFLIQLSGSVPGKAGMSDVHLEIEDAAEQVDKGLIIEVSGVPHKNSEPEMMGVTEDLLRVA